MGHKLLVILTLKVENYQNTELKEWIAFSVKIVWLLECLVVSTIGLRNNRETMIIVLSWSHVNCTVKNF